MKQNFGPAILCFVFSAALLTPGSSLRAEVKDSAADGFALEINKVTDLPVGEAFTAFVKGFGNWWDASHSYSGDPKALSIDLEKACILEKLPEGGFVRHLELAYYHPQKTALRFTGGLGPLQEMGVGGAMTIEISEVDKRTQIQVRYTVAGYSKQQLDKLAPIVDRVLNDQFTRFQNYCTKLNIALEKS